MCNYNCMEWEKKSQPSRFKSVVVKADACNYETLCYKMKLQEVLR